MTVFENGVTAPTWQDSGKYATEEEALASVPHQLNHITTIEAENADLRKQVEDSKVTADQVLDALNPAPAQTPIQPELTSPVISKDEIQTLISETMSAKTVEQKESANIALANAKALELFGDKAQEVTAAKAAELGVNLKFLESVAKTSPDAFTKLLQSGTPPVVDNSGVSTTPSDGAITTPILDSGVKDWAYYSQLRRDNPKHFKSEAIQREMMTQRGKLGDRFLNK